MRSPASRLTYQGGWPLPAGAPQSRPSPAALERASPRLEERRAAPSPAAVPEREYKNQYVAPGVGPKGWQTGGSPAEARGTQVQFPGPPRPPKIM